MTSRRHFFPPAKLVSCYSIHLPIYTRTLRHVKAKFGRVNKKVLRNGQWFTKHSIDGLTDVVFPCHERHLCR